MQDSRHKYNVLSPSLYKDIEFLIAEFSPYKEGDGIDYFQRSGEEYFYVLFGWVHLTVGEHTYILNKDDSCCFVSSILHYYINRSNETAKVIVAVSEPGSNTLLHKHNN